MDKNAIQSGASGGRVTVLAQLMRVGIQFASVVVLSRLLPASDFGLIVMVTAVISLSEILRDAGISTASLRARALSNRQASNLFWINSALGLALTLIIAASGPLLVHMYRQPELALITPALAPTMLLNGLQTQIRVQLSRRGRFRSLAFTEVLSDALALCSALIAAVAGWGYWALVVQALTAPLVLLVSRALILGWHPHRFTRGSGTRPLLASGVGFAAADTVRYLSANVDTMVIGIVWGATPLGLYSRAIQLISQPANRFLVPLVNVVLPTLNRGRSEGHNVALLLSRVQTVISIPLLLMYSAFASSATALIPLALGPGWGETADFVKLLALGAAAQTLTQIALWGFTLEGRSRDVFRCTLATKVTSAIVVVLSVFISIQAAAIAVSVSALLSWVVTLVWMQRSAGIQIAPMMRDGALFIVIGVMSYVTASIVGQLLSAAPLLSAGIPILTCSVGYIALMCAVPQGREGLRTVLKAARIGRSA